MTKWKNLAGKFTDKEIELIEKFQKKYGIKNSSQMVRVSIIFMISYIEFIVAFANSKFAKTLETKYEHLKKEASKVPSLKEQIQPFFKEMDQNLTRTLNEITDRKSKDFSSFTEKRKVGRPKAARKPRGKPKT